MERLDESASTRPDRRLWLPYGGVAVAVLLLYLPVLRDMVSDWWTNPDYSHGFLVPFAIGYLIWIRRADLRKIDSTPDPKALLVIIGSQVVLLVGYVGSEFFLQRFSMILCAIGILAFLNGWKLTRALVFVFVVWAMAIPIPQIAFNALALPLQLIASSTAEKLLVMCQVPVYREGNVLELASQSLNVAEACSGIRSLVSLFTIATILCFLQPIKRLGKAILIVSVIPIALAANAFRIAVTGLLVQHFGPAAGAGFYHAFSGWLVFLAGLVALLAVASLAGRWFRLPS